MVGTTFGGVRVLHDVIHRTADGRRLLVIHGDAFDGVCREMEWLALARLGRLRRLAVPQHLAQPGPRLARARLLVAVGLSQGSGQGGVSASSTATSIRWRPRRAGAASAGVVCGHVHKPDIRIIDGIQYCNDGDWVENCSALVEHLDGRLELVNWAAQRHFDLVTVKPAALRARAGPATAA